MHGFIDIILANKLYMISAGCILGIMIYFVIKKTIKLFLYAFIALIVFIACICLFR